MKPLKELVLEWTSTDGKHSGKAILGHRMKKFQKTVETEEKEIERQYEEWTGVQAEIRRLALEVIGPDGLEGVLAGNIESSTFIDEEQEEMREEIEAEKKRFKEQIEQAGKASMKAMKDGEKVSSLKHY